MSGLRVAEDTRPVVATSGMTMASQGETIPSLSNTSPDAWPGPGFTTGDAVVAASSVSNLVSSLPSELDLQWVQGDTFSVPILFTDVVWLATDPALDAPLLKTVNHRAIASHVATVTTTTAHDFVVGSLVTVAGVGPDYDGTVLVTAVTTNTFSYTVTGANEAGTSSTGTAILANKPAWVETLWAAQVRNPYIFSTYTADYWVPAHGFQYNWWRAHSITAVFHCDSVLLFGYVLDQPEDQFDANGVALDTFGSWVSYDANVTVPPNHTLRWATQVTLTMASPDSENILPGAWYRWDLQSRLRDAVTTYDPTPSTPQTTDDVTTHVRGRVQVVTEWTTA